MKWENGNVASAQRVWLFSNNKMRRTKKSGIVLLSFLIIVLVPLIQNTKTRRLLRNSGATGKANGRSSVGDPNEISSNKAENFDKFASKISELTDAVQLVEVTQGFRETEEVDALVESIAESSSTADPMYTSTGSTASTTLGSFNPTGATEAAMAAEENDNYSMQLKEDTADEKEKTLDNVAAATLDKKETANAAVKESSTSDNEDDEDAKDEEDIAGATSVSRKRDVTCVGDRFSFGVPLRNGEYLCSRRGERFKVGVTYKGDFVYMDTKTKTTITIFKERGMIKKKRGKANYFMLHSNGTMSIYDQLSNGNNPKWSRDSGPKDLHGASCLLGIDCPYLHLHQGGNCVLNWIDSYGSWNTRAMQKIYNFTDWTKVDKKL